ncbi:MAG: response regulator transcription factor [Clostridia bacterium]
MKILIVEDDTILSDTIKQCIVKNYAIEQAYDGYEGYMLAKQGIYDLILLDLMLPEMSGYDVLLKLRENRVYTPVLILTAKDGLQDKVKGFQYGADDYLVKPFEREELLARIEAMLRRSKGSYQKDELSFYDMKLNLKNRNVTIKEETISLQGKQFDILEYLLNARDTIITKEQIFDKIWGFNSETTTNVVEVYASGLRKELKKYGYDQYIKTIRGVGYMLSDK